MRRIYLKFFSVLLAGIILMTSGCAGIASDDDLKKISIALPGSPVTMDPQMVTDSISSNMVDNYCGKLYRYRSDGEIVPDLAESYEVSDDGLTWTYHLDENARWSNGDPVTADDFVFAMQRVADPSGGSSAIYFIANYCKIKNVNEANQGLVDVSEIGVYAIDSETLCFELDEPCPYFNSLVVISSFAPCNRSFYYSCNGHYCESEEYMISCGPFIVDRYEPLATQIELSKNPEYAHSDNVEVDEICIYTVNNIQQGYMCYDIGQVDVDQINGDIIDMIGDDPHIQDEHGGSLYIMFNYVSDAVNNINIRRAMIRSLDRQSIADNVLKGGAAPMTRAVDEGFYPGVSYEEYAEQTEAFDDLCSYDPSAAREYWDQGLEELGVSEVELTLAFANTMSTVIEVVSDQLQRNLPGLTINLVPMTTEQWVANMSGGDYDMILAGWVPDYADPTAYLNAFVTNDNALSPLYSDPDFDALMVSSRDPSVVNDTEARNDVLLEAEMHLAEQAAYIPLIFRGISLMVSDRVSNFSAAPAGGCYILQDMRLEDA